ISGYGLQQATALSREEALGFINAYFEKHPGVKQYVEDTKRQARERGYVETVLGRRRYIPEINSSNGAVRAAAERMAINMPVQGTSADITKLAMIQVQREMDEKGMEARMVLQVHDEVVFEVPEDEVDELRCLVEEVMPRAMTLSVPLRVGVSTSKNWSDMK
ncbi:MAG: DNA polymerase, partial [Chloroflexota bacterium]